MKIYVRTPHPAMQGGHKEEEEEEEERTRMWADAQRDGRPAEYRRRPLFNAAKFG